jgi:hypothetical protein
MLGPWMGRRFLTVGSWLGGQRKRPVTARGVGPVLGQRSRAARGGFRESPLSLRRAARGVA